MKYVINMVLLFALDAVHAETLLRFQKKVQPSAAYVRELLVITPDINHWGKIKLDSHPQAGERISKEHMLRWLQHKVGQFTYQWQGKTTTLVQQNTRSKAEELINTAQTALTKQLKSQGYTRIQLNSKTKLKDSEHPLSDFNVELPQHYPVAKRVCVHLKTPQQSLSVWFVVKAYQKVLVAKQQLKKQHLIQAKDIFWQERNIAGLTNRPLAKRSPTLWLEHTLHKGQILTQQDTSNEPEVKQGQKVQVSVKEQGILIITEAEAQANGYHGQKIPMKSLSTHKLFSAIITGKNQAEVSA